MSDSSSRRDLPLNIRRTPDRFTAPVRPTSHALVPPTADDINWGPPISTDAIRLIQSDADPALAVLAYWRRLPHVRARTAATVDRFAERHPDIWPEAIAALQREIFTPPTIIRRSRRS